MTADEIAATLTVYGWVPQFVHDDRTTYSYEWVGWAHPERNNGMGMLVYCHAGSGAQHTPFEWAFCSGDTGEIVRTGFTPHHAVVLRQIYDYMVNEGLL